MLQSDIRKYNERKSEILIGKYGRASHKTGKKMWLKSVSREESHVAESRRKLPLLGLICVTPICDMTYDYDMS